MFPHLSSFYILLYFFLNHVYKTVFTVYVTPSLSVRFPWNVFFLSYFPICVGPSPTWCYLIFFFNSFLRGFNPLVSVTAQKQQRVFPAAPGWQNALHSRPPDVAERASLGLHQSWSQLSCWCIITCDSLLLRSGSQFAAVCIWPEDGKRNSNFGAHFSPFFFFCEKL